MGQVINQEDLKKAIEVLMVEHPEYFKGIILQVIKDNPLVIKEALKSDDALNKIIDSHFEEYDEVFKALAQIT